MQEGGSLTPQLRRRADAIDTSNVDSEFLSEPALDSVVEDSHLSESTQDAFRGFTYEAPSGLESVR